VIEEKIEGKADKGNIQVFLEGKCQSGFASTRRTINDDDFSEADVMGSVEFTIVVATFLTIRISSVYK
jgi:hypothetical protein